MAGFVLLPGAATACHILFWLYALHIFQVAKVRRGRQTAANYSVPAGVIQGS